MEIIKVLGTPTREEIYSMNPNYTEFKFPKITAHPWSKVFSKRMPPDAVDLVCTHSCASPCNTMPSAQLCSKAQHASETKVLQKPLAAFPLSA